ncbi:hypothetical protein AAG570_000045 [Ranatra chinensis]|uniref:Origin recognition complex subunit 5 n=1 Tax=Ranatra chinensis TaxID=642074 RepID=A0ABD0ZCV5_9HEMI
MHVSNTSLLMLQDDECLPESLFVYGGPSVGKTSIIMRYLECVGLNYARVNCIECYSHRLMFDTLLDQLMPSSGASDKCDNLMQFLAILRIAHQKGHLVRRTVIVLDGIEKLEELSEHYLSAFSRLQELSGVSLLCTIFISHILPEKFNVDSSMIKIRFSQYNKDELLQILQRGKQAHCSEKFFKNYLNAVLSVFLRSTRDLNEMKNLVTMNFKRYCEPIDSGKVEKDDVASLWRHIVPHLKASLNTVYLRTGFRFY